MSNTNTNAVLMEPVAPEEEPNLVPATVTQPKTCRSYTIQVLLTGLPLIASDLFAVIMSILLGFVAGDFLPHAEDASPWRLLTFMSGTVPIIFYLYRLYPGTGLSPILEFRKICIATLLLFTAYVTASLFHDHKQEYPFQLALGFVFLIITLPTLRAVTRRVFSRFSWWGQPILILGSNRVGKKLFDFFVQNPNIGLRPIGIVDDVIDGNVEFSDSGHFLGTYAMAPLIAKNHHAYWAAVAAADDSPSKVRSVVEGHITGFPHVIMVHDMGGWPSLWNRTCDCAGMLGIQMESNLLLPMPRLIKRTFDVFVVCSASIIVLPFTLIIALVIKSTSRGPVFYRQGRVGYGGRRFAIWKFRTMVKDADGILEQHLIQFPELRDEWERTSKIKKDVRITKIGRLLRTSSLDELPQLWNVLIGDMSLVGPRPIMSSEFEKYSQDHKGYDLYKSVRPGITGLWQISGRSNTSYAHRICLDSYYVQNWSPWIDIYILFKTFRAVLRGDGAY